MLTPVEFMLRYRNLKVNVEIDDAVAKVCRQQTYTVQLRNYFMMNWTDGSAQKTEFEAVTSGGSKNDSWLRANKQHIQTAAMGKGAPEDYQLALEWAVRSKKVKNPSQLAVQTFCDQNLGIDCSGFATNYLVAVGKKSYSATTMQDTGATSYFNEVKAVNDPSQVRSGDLLIYMDGNSVKKNPGHVMVVDSYFAQSMAGGNMRVVEATAAPGANPKLLDSMYTVEQVIPKGGAVPVMILVTKRFGHSGFRVSVMRP